MTERYSAAVDRTLSLRDGRQIGFATFGDADGLPVFYLHGTFGSRLEGRIAHVAALHRHVCLIAVDRPGFGLSDGRPDSRLLDWPADLDELADQLAIERFSLLGVAGGGAFALASAVKLPDRVRSVALVSSTAPHDRPGVLNGMDLRARLMLHVLPRRLPWLSRRIHDRAASLADRDPQRLLREASGTLPASERPALDSPEIASIFMDAAYEGFRSGADGMVHELRILAEPWGFGLDGIEAPVFLWHGETDKVSPVEMAQLLAREIAKSQLQIIADRGTAIAVDVVPDAIATLAAYARQSD
ncbi:MAG TPA: alpha/beta hydrolase [Myxococcota bacterium]|nr:alpha/beta hydrolase [Myxococcota bacterium]